MKNILTLLFLLLITFSSFSQNSVEFTTPTYEPTIFVDGTVIVLQFDSVTVCNISFDIVQRVDVDVHKINETHYSFKYLELTYTFSLSENFFVLYENANVVAVAQFGKDVITPIKK